MKRADVIDYELPDEAHSVLHGSVSKGTSVPVLVVAVNDDEGTFSGFAFLPNGQTEYLASVEQPETASEPDYSRPESGVTPDTASDTPSPTEPSETAPQSDYVAPAANEGSNAQ